MLRNSNFYLFYTIYFQLLSFDFNEIESIVKRKNFYPILIFFQYSVLFYFIEIQSQISDMTLLAPVKNCQFCYNDQANLYIIDSLNFWKNSIIFKIFILHYIYCIGFIFTVQISTLISIHLTGFLYTQLYQPQPPPRIQTGYFRPSPVKLLPLLSTL